MTDPYANLARTIARILLWVGKALIAAVLAVLLITYAAAVLLVIYIFWTVIQGGTLF